MSEHEFYEAILAGVEAGTIYAVIDGDELRFYRQQHVTHEIAENALTADEVAEIVRQEQAAAWN